MAISRGGAICASTDIEVTYESIIAFNYNTAEDGGAMYLNPLSTLALSTATLKTSHSHASKYGGVIYYEDSTVPFQCKFEYKNDAQEVKKLPF